MSLAREKHTDNIVIGAGELWISRLDSDDKQTGWEYMGDAIECSLEVQSERLPVYSGSGPIAQKLMDKAKSIDRTLSLTLHDMTARNLSMFIAGTTGTIPADTTAVEDEVIEDVVLGRWYQLGVTAARPMGVGGVDASSVTVSDGSGSGGGVTNYTAGTDYRVDADTGMIQILGGSISAEADVYVDYTPTDATPRTLVTASSLDTPRAAIRYMEQSEDGKKRNLYAPLCSVTGGGNMGLMSRDQEQRLVLSCSILDPEGGLQPVYVYGEQDYSVTAA